MDENVHSGQDDQSETGDERDDAVISADDTGMLAQQHLIVAEEVLLGTQGEEPGKDAP